MKNTFTKIALLVLSFALLACVFVGFVNAEEVSAEESKILAQNVIYNDNVSIVYAVDATVEDAVAGNVKVAYYWEGEETVYDAVLLDTTVADNLYEGKPCFATTGVAPKALGKVAYATVYTGDAPAENAVWKSYSVAEYLYARLHKNGFVNKTEADGKDYNRKLLYQNLLEYAANAQVIFDYNADELVTDYSYAYTTREDVTIGGGKAAFNVATVDPVYTGDASCVGWIATDLEGNETEYPKAAFAVNGVVSIAPKIEVHVCVDENKDHKCDKCSEVMSVCADSNADGLCDVCGVMSFGYTINKGVHLATGSAVLQESFVKGETYTPATTSGVWGNIVTLTKKFEGGREEVSDVLKITINDGSAKNTSVNTLGGIGNVYFTPSKSSDNGGNIHVLEFDFNWAQASKKGWRNPLTIFAYDASGNYLGNVVDANGNNNQYCVWSINNGGAFNEGTVVENAYQLGISGTQTEVAGGKFRLFNSDTWYRIRYIWDESTGNVYISASDDNGETWYQACTVQAKKAMADAAYVAFGFEQMYGAGGYVYFDSIEYNVVSELPELPANNGL